MPSRESGSVVAALLQQRQALAVGAFDGEQTKRLTPPGPLPEDFDIYAAYYPESVFELGLDEGWMGLRAGGRPIPKSAEVRVSFVRQGRQSPWETTDSAQVLDELGLDLPKPSACYRPSVKYVDIEGTKGDEISAAVTLGANDELLLGLASGRFFVVSTTTQAELAAPLDAPKAGAVRSPDGRIWLVGNDRRIMVTSFDSKRMALELSETSSASGAPAGRIWLAAADVEPFELFALTDTGRLERFDEARRRWALVYEDPTREVDRGRRIAWVSPGVCALLKTDPPHVCQTNAEGCEDLRHPSGPSPEIGPDSIATIAGLGVVTGIGTDNPAFRRFDPSSKSWEALPGLTIEYRVHVMAPFGDGFVYAAGDAFRQVRQFSNELGYCEPVAVAWRRLPQFFLAAQTGYWLIQEGVSGSSDLQVEFVTFERVFDRAP